jgi:hypothetical protein
MQEMKTHPITLIEFQFPVLVIIPQLVVVLRLLQSFRRVQKRASPDV